MTREVVVNYYGPKNPTEINLNMAFLSDLPQNTNLLPDKVDQMLASTPTSDCPQYEGIRDYIRSISEHRKLALDLNPGISIPEHVLLNHIRRYLVSEGQAPPSPENWRTFLRTCHDRQEMFRYVKNFSVFRIINRSSLYS